MNRPFRLRESFKWVALGLAVLYFIVWLGGGIAYPFIGDQAIYYFLGWIVAACYLPLYWYREREDRRLAETSAAAAQPVAPAEPAAAAVAATAAETRPAAGPPRPLTEES